MDRTRDLITQLTPQPDRLDPLQDSEAMHLTLKPPSDYPVPSVFHTHVVSRPKLPRTKTLKVPLRYSKAKLALNNLGLGVPSYLTADKALWWHFVIDRIEWNLDTLKVVVTLADGTEERWDLSEPRSSETVADDEEDEELEGEAAAKRNQNARSQASTFKSRWSPDMVLARLRSLSIELRSAYEDITTSAYVDTKAPRLSTDQDYLVLMSLAADPSLEIPIEWTRGKTPSSYFMDEELVDLLDGPEPESRDTDGEDSAVEPRQGQFRSRRRPLRIPVSYANARTPSSSDSPRRTHDYLSLVDLLSHIRAYLLELLPATIFPRLRERLPPTYPLWCVGTAISWCRRLAIEHGCEAGIIILELLEDEPEAILDRSHDLLSDYDDSEQPSSDLPDSDYGEDSWGIEIKDGPKSVRGDDHEWDTYLRMDKKRSDNPLNSMRDDFQLRCWAEDAIERQRAVEREQWLEKPANPQWRHPPEPVEVSAPLDTEEESSEIDEPVLRNSNKSRAPFSPPFRSGLSTVSVQPRTSPIPAPRNDSLAFMPDASTSGPPSSSSASSELDHQSDPSSDDSTTCSDFFYLDDPLDEEFLPPKLPKAVVTASSSRGRDMERARTLLHAKLNEIAGLERKLRELYEFSTNEQDIYEEGLELLHQTKDKYTTTASGLRTPRPSLADPPPVPRRKTPLPLKAQPLRHQTADNALTTRLRLALNRLEPGTRGARPRKTDYVTSRAGSQLSRNKRKVLSTPKPRKRQKYNLDTLDKVHQLQKQICRDSRAMTAGAGTKKKAKSRQEPTALAEKAARANGAGSGAGTRMGTSKRPPKGRALRREDPVTDFEPLLSAPPEPESPTPSPSAEQPSARRLTLLELSRCRPPLKSDGALLPQTLGPVSTVPSSSSAAYDLSYTAASGVEVESELTDGESEAADDGIMLDFDCFGVADHPIEDAFDFVETSVARGSDDEEAPISSLTAPRASNPSELCPVPAARVPTFSFPLSNSRYEYNSFDLNGDSPLTSRSTHADPLTVDTALTCSSRPHDSSSLPALERFRHLSSSLSSSSCQDMTPSLSTSTNFTTSPSPPRRPREAAPAPLSSSTGGGIASRTLNTMSLAAGGGRRGESEPESSHECRQEKESMTSM